MKSLVVGIAAHREADHIGHTIESIWNARLPSGVSRKRIIVCANDWHAGELRRVVDAVEKKRAELDIPRDQLDVVEEQFANKPNALNRIMRHSWVREKDTAALAFFDADVIVPKHTLANMYSELQMPRLQAVGAHIIPSSREKLVEALAHIPQHVAGFKYLDGKGMMLKPSAVAKIRAIPNNVIDDDVYISAKLGPGNIRKTARANVIYHAPTSLRELFGQATRQWRGVIQARRLFGKKVIDELVNPSILAALQKALKSWKSLSTKEKMAVMIAPTFYSAVKGRALVGKQEGGTWTRQPTTKRA